MATKVIINGKPTQKPGVYSTIISGITNPSTSRSPGNILLIDDGIGAGYGGGSGVNGTNASGVNTVYSFTTPQDFQAFIKGGELYNMAPALFNPAPNQLGVATLFFIKAATTTPAQVSLALGAGHLVIGTKDEGISANGVLANTNLASGYAAKLIQSNGRTVSPSINTAVTQSSTSTLPEINTITVQNIKAGDTFTITDSGTSVSYTATSDSPYSTYKGLAIAINANGTLSAIFTATATVSGLILTADTANTPFTQTSTVTAAPVQAYLQIWHGSYAGFDSTNNTPYSGIADVLSTPTLVIQSPAFTTFSSLISWMSTDQTFNTGFSLVSQNLSGSVVSNDISTNATYQVFAGATENYGSSDFDSALSAINNYDFTHIFALNYGANAQSTNNGKIFNWVKNVSKYNRLMVVAGGYDKDTCLTGTYSSAATAAYYNSDQVIVIHGGVKKKAPTSPSGFNVYSQLYKAAIILGRCAGLPSQVPVTLKSLGIDGEVHQLSDDEQEALITAGVVYSYFDYDLQNYVVGLDTDTLQNNTYLVNNDGTTYSWQLKRIEAELNKFIVVTGKQRFFNPNGQGGNRNSTSPEEVISWLQTQLGSRTASAQNDDLIISYKNVAASISQDNISATYQFVGNTEIKALVVTGTLIAG